MKIFISVLVLIFSIQSWAKADDIKDFQIEGMSIGDSLLNYFSEGEIKKNINSNYYKNNKFTSTEFYDDKFKTYESVEINFLTSDKEYTIEGISGAFLCGNDFSKCKNLEKKIKVDISNQFKNLPINSYKKSHSADKSGQSKVFHHIFEYQNGDMIVIETIDWSNQITKKYRWTDNVNVNLRSNKFNKFLGIAFK